MVFINKINWAIGRQNVTVALLVSTLIGSFTIMRLGGSGAPVILAPLLVVVLFEFWAIFNFESAIIQCQLELGKIRIDWEIRKDSLVWFWFKANGTINYWRFIPTGIFIIIGYVITYWVLIH